MQAARLIKDQVVVLPVIPVRDTKNTVGMSLVDLGKRLLDAAKRGETEEVRTLMSNGAPFTTDWLGTSPLHFATQYGHMDTAEVLLRAGISRDARTKVDRTPLHVAAQEGHLEIVELLIQHAADIDAKDMLKMTPLHWATEKGHMAVMESLIKHGADINCENKFDKTPLDIAVSNGRADLAQILQLAQHTEVTGLGEGESVTIETTEVDAEAIETVTVTTSDTSTTGVLPVNLYHNMATTKDSKSTDQNNSSVLATLAALAEATAPGTTPHVNTSEAMNWLESQGITMITTSEGSMITSAVESGQTITLTEAGKIALNLIKQQGLQTPSDGEIQGNGETTLEDDQQKVITIVAQDVPSAETEELEIAGTSTDTTEEPPAKRMKTEQVTTADIEKLLENKNNLESLDKEALKKQLEEIQKQAEAYKFQLKQKEQEAEQYKKKLSEIHTTKDVTDEGETTVGGIIGIETVEGIIDNSGGVLQVVENVGEVVENVGGEVMETVEGVTETHEVLEAVVEGQELEGVVENAETEQVLESVVENVGEEGILQEGVVEGVVETAAEEMPETLGGESLTVDEETVIEETVKTEIVE